MNTFTVAKNLPFTNIHSLLSIDPSETLVVTNAGAHTFYVFQGSILPSSVDLSFPILPGRSVVLSVSDDPWWVAGGSVQGYASVGILGESLHNNIVDLPNNLYTSRDKNFGRIRVDVGQTGLFEGREFRLVRKISIPAATPLVFRFTCTTDFMLFEQTLNCSEGDIEYFAWRDTQGTAGGTFTNLPIPPIGKNISSYYRKYNGARYTTQASIASGGTFTPTNSEIYVDYDRSKTAGATGQRNSVSGGDDSVRYLAAGTYYLKLTSLEGTSVGRFAIAWEEREL